MPGVIPPAKMTREVRTVYDRILIELMMRQSKHPAHLQMVKLTDKAFNVQAGKDTVSV